MFRLSKFFSSKVRVRSFSLPPKELGPSPCPLRLVERLEAEGVPHNQAKILTEAVMERTAISMKPELDLLRTELKLEICQSLSKFEMEVKDVETYVEKGKLDIVKFSLTSLGSIFLLMLGFARVLKGEKGEKGEKADQKNPSEGAP